uniref:Reverse transcriptase domain-containing protein n=1 Tax=Xenopus tropicalis TaxID=8364 RepID=A0A803JJ24_XENTR
MCYTGRGSTGNSQSEPFFRDRHRKRKYTRRGGGGKSQGQTSQKADTVIFNLSQHVLTPGEVSLLSRGLSFVPVNKKDPFDLEVDLFKFQRKLKLRDHFKDSQDKPGEKFRPVSTFEPPNTATSIKTFSQIVQRDCNDILKKPKKFFPNLTKAERDAIISLRNDKQLIVRPADKGGAVVLLDLAYYRQEVLQQLSNIHVYDRLPGDPTYKFKQKLDIELELALSANWISQDCYNFLTIKFPRCPAIYTLPKIHKNLSAPPGRPIISARGSLFSNVAIFLDSFLQPLCARMRSYVADTASLLEILRHIGPLPENTLFVTLDVCNLYTIIPLNEGLAACKEALIEGHQGLPPVEFLCSLLRLVFTCNYFRFERTFYLQKTGTAMGSNVAPSYANLYMNFFELEFIYPVYSTQLLLYCRYIDDIFILWRGDHIGVESFVASLNALSTPVKFTLNYAKDTIDFLDVRIYRTSTGVGTTLYRKETDRNTLLHAHSFHPPSVIKSIPYTQFLRVFRINTDFATASQQALEMCNRFISRGYTADFLHNEMEKAIKRIHDGSLETSSNKIQHDRMTFVTDYTPMSHDINNVLKRHWPILQLDSGLPFTKMSPPMCAYRRGRSLRDILMVTDLKHEPGGTWLKPGKPGCFKCGGCITCGCLITGNTFAHPHTGKKYLIKHRLTCVSDYVIYCIMCPCGLYYIGKCVTSFRIRMNNHRSVIRAALASGKSDIPLARHFAQQKHSLPMLRAILIDHIPVLSRGGDRSRLLLQREAQWIRRLDTIAPRGLNEMFSLSCFL